MADSVIGHQPFASQRQLSPAQQHAEQMDLLKSLDQTFDQRMSEKNFAGAAFLATRVPEDNYRKWLFVQQTSTGAAKDRQFNLALQLAGTIPENSRRRSQALSCICEEYANNREFQEADNLASSIQNSECQSSAYKAISGAYVEVDCLILATEAAKKATSPCLRSEALQRIYPKLLEQGEIDEALNICWQLPVFAPPPCPGAAPDLFALDHKCRALVDVCSWLAEYGQSERAQELCDEIPSDLHKTRAQELIDQKAGGRARQQAIEAALAAHRN